MTAQARVRMERHTLLGAHHRVVHAWLAGTLGKLLAFRRLPLRTLPGL